MADLRPGFRTKFKGNPQQGTLFHAKAAELDPTGQRYQSIRGFTPERQREVGEAMGEVGFSRRDDLDATAFEGPSVLSPDEFGGMVSAGDQEKRDLGEGGARMREALARSSAPVEDIASVKQYAVAPNLPVNGLWLPREETLLFARSAQEVDRHREGFGTGYPTPEVQRLDAGQTVVHELGHAADPTLTPERGVRNELSGHDMGQLEQTADDYAGEHFRPDPRAGRRATFAVETGMYPGAEPNDVAPQRLAGYEAWGERSDAAARDLRPRHEAAEDAGTRYPQTASQTRWVERTRRREYENSPPRMFQGSRPHPDAL